MRQHRSNSAPERVPPAGRAILWCGTRLGPLIIDLECQQACPSLWNVLIIENVICCCHLLGTRRLLPGVAKACLAWEQPSILRTVTLLTIMTSHHKFLILSIYQSNLQEFHTNYIIYFLWEPSLQGTLAVTILAKEIS